MWSLPLLYLVFAIVVALLYFPCRWYARIKAERNESWLQDMRSPNAAPSTEPPR